MTPKQQRLQHYNRYKKYILIRKFIFGTVAIAGLIKLIQLGLEYLQ